MLLDNKVAIVSGVGPGLGRATARVLAREGATVVLAARNQDNLEAVAAEIESDTGRAIVHPTDLVDTESVDALVKNTLDQCGRIDVLVNNAFRMSTMTPFEQADLSRWRKVYDVNVFGALTLTQRCIEALRRAATEHGDASIVFVSSLSSRKMTMPDTDYSTSKGAVNTAVRCLATELGADRIRVNGVLPGWIGGPNVQLYLEWQAAERRVPASEIRAEIEARIPLGFIPPQDDIASAILFFASPLARVITGQLLDVNGGEWMGP